MSVGHQWPPVSTKLREPGVPRVLNEFDERGVDDRDHQPREQSRLAELPAELFRSSPRIDQPAHTPDDAVSAAEAGRLRAT